MLKIITIHKKFTDEKKFETVLLQVAWKASLKEKDEVDVVTECFITWFVFLFFF